MPSRPKVSEQSLISELKRRNVFKVGMAYSIVA